MRPEMTIVTDFASADMCRKGFRVSDAMSKSDFCYQDAKNMGITFSKYIMQRKMSHACHFLETTTWSVDRIAHELGFCDISHFIQRFKAIEGMTPRAYRLRSGKSSGDSGN